MDRNYFTAAITRSTSHVSIISVNLIGSANTLNDYVNIRAGNPRFNRTNQCKIKFNKGENKNEYLKLDT